MKKLIVLISLVAAILATLTICASAEMILNQDFSAESTDVLHAMTDISGLEGVVREFVDGAIHVYNPTESTVSQALKCRDTSLPENFVFQFDVRSDMNPGDKNGYIMMNLYCGAAGRTRLTLRADTVSAAASINAAHQKGVWYTYYIKVTGTKVDLFRKLRDSEDLPVVLAENYDIEAEHNSMPTRIEAYGAKGTDVYLDNIKVYSGTFVESASFDVDGEEVNTIADIDGGLLNARIEMVTDEAKIGEVDGTMCEVSGDATPIMVVYDKDRKMIYSDIFTGSGVHMGRNVFEVSVDTGIFADKVEGGYLGIYLWDSFGSLQPVMDAIELK